MKPYFSIAELAKLLSDDYTRVADALLACGVPLIYEGKPADLSRWERIQPERRNSDGAQVIFVKTGGLGPSPNPEAVVVSTDKLPESWISRLDALSDEDVIEEYRRIPRKDCEKLTNLVLAAEACGECWDEPVSRIEATDALVSAYRGGEMLFDGTWTGLVEPFSEKHSPCNEDSLALKMADCVAGLYNYKWWEPSEVSINSDRLYFVENLMILQDDVPVLWGRMCDILFRGKYKDDYWESIASAQEKSKIEQKKVPANDMDDSEELKQAKIRIAELEKQLAEANAVIRQNNERMAVSGIVLPHMNKALAAVFKIMEDNWRSYDAKRLPKQVNISREIDAALGWGNGGDSDKEPSRNAKVVAMLIKPDEVGDTE